MGIKFIRLHLNRSNKYIGLFDENKKEEKEHIQSIDEIYNFEKRLLQTVDYYEATSDWREYNDISEKNMVYNIIHSPVCKYLWIPHSKAIV